MRVKITDSFVEGGATAVQRGCVMEVPELLARTWIRIKRAVEFPDPSLRPQKIAEIEQPGRRPTKLERPSTIKKARH
jgi:hypothetical protein